MKRAIVTSILVAGLAFGTVGSTYAAKGENNGKGSSANLEFSDLALQYECETPGCPAGDIVHFWGEGYDASQGKALLQIGGALWTAVAVAEDGTVEFQWNYFQIPGTYSVQLYQNQGQKLELKGEVSVTIN